MNDFVKNIGANISDLPMKETQIISGIEPRVKCKNHCLQQILIKLFGYKAIYKTIKAKTVHIKPEDYVGSPDRSTTLTFDYWQREEGK